MDTQASPVPEADPREIQEAANAGDRARRTLVIGLVAVGLFLIGLVALLVVLSVDAYHTAAQAPTATEVYVVPAQSPGAAVISLLRDVAIVLVAFETLVIGLLAVVLILQVQALIGLLRDEIKPMLESVNDTVATVRGTTRFVSHHVVSPAIQAVGFLAGVRRVVQEIVTLGKSVKKKEEGDGEE
ncbi:MAG TPA: hypothetical protein ENK08_07675 [Chloroflexi bacterium]|nr:hypothetical protein [Chloroflexota bacterium]